MARPPRRGDIWLVDLGHPVGHEAGSRRFGLVVSADAQNQLGIITILPITETRTGYASNVEVEPSPSGLQVTSYIQVEQVRSVSAARLETLAATVDPVTMVRVEQILGWILSLR